MKFTDVYGTDDTWTEDLIYTSVGPGWKKLLQELLADLEKLGWNGELHQVKEKFGGLRFYIGEGTDEIFKRIGKAQEESFKICEKCGNPGSLRGRYWFVTLCDDCENKTLQNCKTQKCKIDDTLL